ncbi:Hypothetical predicted protein, partial [Mytilus galloprovincialis]
MMNGSSGIHLRWRMGLHYIQFGKIYTQLSDTGTADKGMVLPKNLGFITDKNQINVAQTSSRKEL